MQHSEGGLHGCRLFLNVFLLFWGFCAPDPLIGTAPTLFLAVFVVTPTASLVALVCLFAAFWPRVPASSRMRPRGPFSDHFGHKLPGVFVGQGRAVRRGPNAVLSSGRCSGFPAGGRWARCDPWPNQQRWRRLAFQIVRRERGRCSRLPRRCCGSPGGLRAPEANGFLVSPKCFPRVQPSKQSEGAVLCEAASGDGPAGGGVHGPQPAAHSEMSFSG